MSAFEPCTAQNEYEYEEGRPCIFLKLNKIFNWQPQYYKKEDKLPTQMPEPLKRHIEQRNSTGKSLEVVWVSCQGENPSDIENLGLHPVVKYYSLSGEQGFLGRYFPFKNTEGYLQPLVAVQFGSVKRKNNNL